MMIVTMVMMIVMMMMMMLRTFVGIGEAVDAVSVSLYKNGIFGTHDSGTGSDTVDEAGSVENTTAIVTTRVISSSTAILEKAVLRHTSDPFVRVV